MADRDFDLVLYGATGFVGRLTAEYLVRAAPAGARIALAGRSADRLARVQGELGVDWPLLTADSGDADALGAIARRTTAFATTVGPYRSYGFTAAEQCARAGTHYADLTGEILFVRETLDRLDATARAAGARIVHACGFDSIPSDLGMLLLHEAAGGPLAEATLVVRSLRGGLSGGTFASMKGMVDEARRDAAARRLMLDPYALSPRRDAEPDLGRQSDVPRLHRDDALGGWIGPFVMASFNTRIVRMSNALQDWRYGRELRYREVMSFGGGRAAPALAAGTAAGLGALMGGLAFPPTRYVLDRVLPSPGEGPSEEARRKGFFRLEIHGRTEAGTHHVARVAAQGDPGYAATAVMLGEAGLALALDGEQLPDRAGVLTPATAIGMPLVERLRAAGHTYEPI